MRIGRAVVLTKSPLCRFRSFLLFLGYDMRSVQDVKIMNFCRTLREFALEYRTCRERVLQQRKKRAACRERNKTRGKMITEVGFVPLPSCFFDAGTGLFREPKTMADWERGLSRWRMGSPVTNAVCVCKRRVMPTGAKGFQVHL